MKLTIYQIQVLYDLWFGPRPSTTIAARRYQFGAGYAEKWARGILSRLKKRGLVEKFDDVPFGTHWKLTSKGLDEITSIYPQFKDRLN